MLDTAVIPCGGLGTRLHPITRWLPKEMLPVALRPVLHWALDEAADAGLLRAIIIALFSAEPVLISVVIGAASLFVTIVGTIAYQRKGQL